MIIFGLTIILLLIEVFAAAQNLSPDILYEDADYPDLDILPKCFYCSSQLGKQWDQGRVSYTALKLNVTEECMDICSKPGRSISLNSQLDCANYIIKTYQTTSGFYYAYDERVQTCFGFDPRDELKRPLARLLPQNEASASGRHLQM